MADLFASSQPEHEQDSPEGAEITVQPFAGSALSGPGVAPPSSLTRRTGDTAQSPPSPTMEPRIARSRRQRSTRDSDELPGGELTQQLDGIVERFRLGEIDKPDAVLAILHQLNHSSESKETQHSAFKQYATELDRTQALAARALGRGLRHQDGTRPPDDDEGETPDSDEGPTQLFEGTVPMFTRKRNHTARDRDDSDVDDADGDRPPRKRKINEAELPWFHKDQVIVRVTDPVILENRRLLQYYARDITRVKESFMLSPSAPDGIPAAEVENALRGLPINLDNIFSALQHIRPPKEGVGRIGSTEIRLETAQPAKKVQTAGEWQAAWTIARRLLVHVFPQ
jgi:hypothetical protein